MEQLEQLQRPLTMETGGIVLMDLLWRCARDAAMHALARLTVGMTPHQSAIRPKTTASWGFGLMRADLAS